MTNHWDENGQLRMVDVSDKEKSRRVAVASGCLLLQPAHLAALSGNPKGDVFAAARLAGIQAAKKCAELVPLCHTLSLQSIQVELQLEGLSIWIQSEVIGIDVTGVEMEAYCAVAIAGITLIDMLKGTDPDLVLTQIRLESKTGGKSNFKRNPKPTG